MTRMHDDEIVTDSSVARRLVAAQFPRWADLPVTPVRSAGTDNALYRLGSDLVVRLPRLPGPALQVERDHEWLPRIAPCVPLAVPEPVAIGEPDDGYPCRWAIHRWLDGTALTDTPNLDLGHAATALGAFVTALRSLDLEGPPSRRGAPVEKADAYVRRHAAELRPGDLPDDVEPSDVLAAWERAAAAAPWDGQPCWLHGDLLPTNMLARDGRVTAVIDFGLVGVGDPACDLIPAWTVLDAATRPAFRAIAAHDDAMWERGRGWALTFVGGVTYYRDTNRPFAAMSRRVVTEAVRDTRAR